MRKLYDGFFTVHKEVFHLHGLHQWRKEFVKTIKNIHVAITYVHEWTIWFKGAMLELLKKMKPQEDLEKAKVRMLIHNKKKFASFIGITKAWHVWLYSSLDVLVKTHQIPSINSLTKVKPKNQVRWEVQECLE